MKFRSPLDWFRFQVCLRTWLICFASALFAFIVIPRLSLLVAQDGYYEDPDGYEYYDPNYGSEDGQTDDYGDPYADEDNYDDGTAYDSVNDSGYPDDTTYDYPDSAGSGGNSESATGSLTGDPNLDFSDGNWPDRLSWNFNSMGPYPYGYLDADTDMDSLNDIFELNYGNWVEEVTGQYEAPDGTVYESTDWVWRGMNPNSPDSESDGLGDFEELFVLSPMMEALGAGVGFDPTDPRDAQRDLDGDFVPDHVELLDTGSDIFRKDTDGDEYDDFEEWMLGSDPNDPEDPPAGTDHPEKPDPPLPPPPPGDDPGPDPEPEPPLQPGGDGDDPGPDTPPTDPPTDPPNPDPPGDSNGGGGRPPTEEEEGDLSKQIFVEMRTVSVAYGDTGGDSGDGNGEWIPIYGPDPDDPSMEIVVGYRWEGATEDSEQGGETEYFSAISQFENGELQSDREDNLNSASSARSNVEAADMSQSVDWKREDTYRTFEEENGDGGTDSPHVSGVVAASFKAKKTPNDEGKDLEEGSGFLSELRLVRKTEADNRDYVKVTRPVTKRFLVVFESEPVDTPLGTDTVIEQVKAIELTIEEDEAVSVRDNQDPVSENVIEVPIVVGKRMTARLLPVEILQPELDEDLDLVKDDDGKEKLVGGNDLRFCRWFDAFEGDEIWRSGNRTFKNDFVEKDRDRIVVRVPGEVSEEPTLKGYISTTLADGSILDNETDVEFKRNEDDDFEYTMALMTASMDDDFDPERSGVEEIGGGAHVFRPSDDEKNDPTHEGHFGGEVEFKFPDLDDAKFKQKITKAKASVSVDVYFLVEHEGSLLPYSKVIAEDFRVAHELYAQLGIELKINPNSINLTEDQTESLYGDNDFECVATTWTMSSDLENLFQISGLPSSRAKIPTIFYVATRLDAGLRFGASFPKDTNEATGYGFVTILNPDLNTFAHELGHLLGLADNPLPAIHPFQMHHDRNAKHYLMADSVPWSAYPIDCGRRFTAREIQWLFDPRQDRNALEAAKSYISVYED